MAKKEKTLELTVPDNSYDLESVKNELKDYVTLEIKKQYNDELDKVTRKLIKEKNKKIIFKNIFIVLLILIIIFLLYIMYNDGYFNRLFNKKEEIINPIDNKEENSEENSQKEEKKPTIEELKKEYSSLLENIYINEKSIYLRDYYEGKLYDEIKNYLALNLVDFRELNKEDDYNIISDDVLRIKYNKIFDDEYKSVNFNYNGNVIRYINVINSYVTTNLLEEEQTSIKRDITNIVVDGEKVIIETDEYLLKDSKKYNILTNNEITELNDGIIHMLYTFNKGNLVSLENRIIES